MCENSNQPICVWTIDIEIGIVSETRSNDVCLQLGNYK